MLHDKTIKEYQNTNKKALKDQSKIITYGMPNDM